MITERERYLMRTAIKYCDDPAKLDKWLATQNSAETASYAEMLNYDAIKYVEKLTITPPTEEKISHEPIIY